MTDIEDKLRKLGAIYRAQEQSLGPVGYWRWCSEVQGDALPGPWVQLHNDGISVAW